MGKRLSLTLALFATLVSCSGSFATEFPVLKETINDFAGMMPETSAHDLEERLKNFRKQTGHIIVVVTVRTLEEEDIESFSRKAFQSLQLPETELKKSVLLLVALKDRKVTVQTGSEMRDLFPEPASSQKLQAQVGLYFDGMRRDLGLYAGVNYIFQVVKGEVHVDSITDLEKLEEASIKGGGAGAILAVFLAPFLAFMVGALWGIYATKLGLERGLRLFMGGILGGGTAKSVAILMAFVSSYSAGLWYFILAISIPLGVFGSLTEFWMSGEWSGIPRVKDPIKRKPEDNMGI
ncbi:MAG: TPM domain-containing protein [Deltaproteobacteria bacterium]|nr:TPM domain-containing protein [Deltaproteobacteria bacterium]